MRAKHLAAVAGAALLAAGASAAPSVEVVNVQQQYPWTNTVDITYSVQGVKDFPAKTATGEYASNETYFVTFTAKCGDTTLADVSGNTVFTNALVEGNGTHVAQWQPALGQQFANCTATPSVFRGEDDAYMIVNLETNALGKFDVCYEPMSTQDASNKRYNTPEYKTTKLVLRRIPAGTYTIGHATQKNNTPHETKMEKTYYMGIFELTAAQYSRIVTGVTLSNSSNPRVNIRWADMRGGASPGATPTQGLVAELCQKSGLAGFDLPTTSMWEVGARAGCRTRWLTGESSAGMAAYAWYGGQSIHAVGSLLPNNWGFYDVNGNIYEQVRDIWNDGNLATLQPNGQTPITTGNNRYGTFRSHAANNDIWSMSLSTSSADSQNGSWWNTGCRIACIPQAAEESGE